MRRRAPAAAALAALVVAALAACGDDAGRTIAPDGAPYRYVVPSGLRIRDDVQVVSGADDARYLTAVALDRDDLITVSAYSLASSVAKVDAAALRAQLDASVEDSIGARATVTGPRTVPITGGSAYQYILTGTRSPDGDPASLRVTYALRGTDEVVVVCRGAGKAVALMKACDRVVASLQLRS